MGNTSTNINKPLILNHCKQKTTTKYDVGNLGPSLGNTHTLGGLNQLIILSLYQ
jgi:hypothetical protein